MKIKYGRIIRLSLFVGGLPGVNRMETKGRIFQTGEKVRISATYAVVGIGPNATARKRESPVRDFHIGEAFPVYDGMEVAWWLVEEITITTEHPEVTTADS
jgi:hypothetical protein